jgi:hypothetical protein
VANAPKSVTRRFNDHDSGVQHPAPPLAAAAQWQAPVSANLPPVLLASAAYAIPARDGQIVGDGLPRTTVAFVLYAQVPQADGSTFRNTQLGHAVAQPVRGTPGATAVAQLQQADIIRVLDELALPRDAGLSVIGVEFLPSGGGTRAFHPSGTWRRCGRSARSPHLRTPAHSPHFSAGRGRGRLRRPGAHRGSRTLEVALRLRMISLSARKSPEMFTGKSGGLGVGWDQGSPARPHTLALVH